MGTEAGEEHRVHVPKGDTSRLRTSRLCSLRAVCSQPASQRFLGFFPPLGNE